MSADLDTAAPFHLRCRTCRARRGLGPLDYRCTVCGGELVSEVDVPGSSIAPAASGMWRYAPWLPVTRSEAVVSLGEGDTPLVPLGRSVLQRLGVHSVAMKCEHLNPTGSFKDRIASVAVSIAVERALRGLAGTSSGNGGAAAAAYAARAGLPLVLFALTDVVAPKLMQISAFGATVVFVDGLGHDAAATEQVAMTVAEHAAGHDVFPFLTGGRYSPEAMEGAKTIAHELADEAPETTLVYAPVGGGGLVAALGRGFAEVARDGRAVPRVVAVQPEGCATIRQALAGDMSGLTSPCTSGISGLQVAQLFDGQGAVEALSGTGGHLTEVSDEQIYGAQRLLARESGLLVEPAGATALAGALSDAADGRLNRADRVVVLGTGAGYKDSVALQRLTGEGSIPTIGIDQISEVLRERT